MNDDVRLDIKQLVAERFPGEQIPGFLIHLLAKILRQDAINELFIQAQGKTGLDFVDVCVAYLDFLCNVKGEENLPSGDDPLIFVCNHPQGGVEAICLASFLGHKYNGKIRLYANEMLSILHPLNELFLPIYKHGAQSRENLCAIKSFYETDNHLIVFPAGVTAHKFRGKIVDNEWHKHFIKSAVHNKRDVVPLYFQARNSDFFYFIENFRRRIHAKINFEVILFANEFFKQKGNTFNLYIGKPIPWETFDQTRSPQEWAKWVREYVFNLSSH
ncbi:MAG: 1-acyl-sn-glycerol-3-phosphate acyltransferase [Massilibacteroides sp.]|nr:1-acyl-sn-glycerol-3-phosphate acyltransferase [Massilibacteroides sp.]MDD4114657.1 1-acyl-sn-glycerol-3-phosphate acyltransferase [Massilibacteroides sp.]MDD4660815.1 1-acyl-sn-glycerol-3-phosphate acyltransferase [Massilibacteroides sp.]